MATLEIQYIESRLVLFQKTYKSEPQRSEIRECIKEMKSYSSGDVKCFIKEHTMFIDTLISLLDCSKTPLAVIELVYACLIADMFAHEHILAIVNQIGKQSWSSQARMKILQMSFYFVRFDLYTGKEAFKLLRFIIECLDPSDPNLDSAARPIAVLLIEKILKKAVVCKKSYCDLDLETLKSQLNEGAGEAVQSESVEDDERSQINMATNGGPPLKYSRSYELLKEADLSYSEDLTELLEFVYAQVHGKSSYNIGFILLSIIKHPEIFTIPGIEEFVRSKFFTLCHDILKYGKAEDKEPVYDSILKIQESYGTKFGACLEEFYSKLLRHYGDKGDGFFRFVQGLFAAVLSEQRKGSSDGCNIPVQLYDVFNKTLDDLNLGRKADGRRFQFLENTLLLLKNNTEFYNDAVDKILLKMQGTREISVPVDGFIDESLKIVARNGHRDVFDRLLSICTVESMLGAAFEMRWFMKDSWCIVMKRSTRVQRAPVITRRLSMFSLDELECFTRHIEEEEIESVFESTLDLLVLQTHLKLFEDLIRKVTKFDLLSAILVRFYSHVQSTVHQHGAHEPCGAADSLQGTGAQAFDPGALAATSNKEAALVVPISPLNILRAHVENNQHCYKRALSCLSDIIRIMDPSDCWEVIFAIIDVCRDSIDDQVPILLSITENFINGLEDRFVIKILNILKRMSLSQDNNTCLNSLFIYQEVGEFLITNSILESGGGVDVYGRARGASSIPTALAGKRARASKHARNIKIWRDFIILGAVIMKDPRIFMPLSIIRYIMSFIKAEYIFFDDNDFKFIEKIVFEQFLKIGDQEISLFILDEMNEYIKNYSLREFTGMYVSHLSKLICEGDDLKAEKAFKGLQFLVLSVYEETNYVVCDSADDRDFPNAVCADAAAVCGGPHGSGNASKKPFRSLNPLHAADRNEGRKFVIKNKQAHPLRQDITATFVSLLQNFTTKRNRLLKDVLQIFILFSYDLREIYEFVDIFYKLLQTNTSSVAEIVDCVERMCFVSGVGNVALVTFSKWLNDGSINVLFFNDDKTPVFELLLFKIGEIMNRQGWTGSFDAVLQNLLMFVKDDSADQTIDCVIRGCANIEEREHLDVFVKFSYSLFTTNVNFVESRKRERKFLEFISFYHGSLQAYYKRKDGAAGGPEKKAYDLILYLTTKSYKNLRLKSYQILFSDIARCQDVLIAQLRSLLSDYIRDFKSSGEFIENIRVIEMVYCLRCIVALNDKTVIDMLKNEMAELLVCGDFDILDSVRKCFKILFT